MNWLVIAVIVLIVLATLAGAKRGLVKTVLWELLLRDGLLCNTAEQCRYS